MTGLAHAERKRWAEACTCAKDSALGSALAGVRSALLLLRMFMRAIGLYTCLARGGTCLARGGHCQRERKEPKERGTRLGKADPIETAALAVNKRLHGAAIGRLIAKGLHSEILG